MKNHGSFKRLIDIESSKLLYIHFLKDIYIYIYILFSLYVKLYLNFPKFYFKLLTLLKLFRFFYTKFLIKFHSSTKLVFSN